MLGTGKYHASLVAAFGKAGATKKETSKPGTPAPSVSEVDSHGEASGLGGHGNLGGGDNADLPLAQHKDAEAMGHAPTDNGPDTAPHLAKAMTHLRHAMRSSGRGVQVHMKLALHHLSAHQNLNEPGDQHDEHLGGA